jgi:hypothetical protein
MAVQTPFLTLKLYQVFFNKKGRAHFCLFKENGELKESLCDFYLVFFAFFLVVFLVLQATTCTSKTAVINMEILIYVTFASNSKLTLADE